MGSRYDRPAVASARSIFLLLPASLLALVLAASACSGGGDDDDDDSSPTPTVTPAPDPTPIPGSVAEAEPNDDSGEATAVAGSAGTLAFHGRCSQTGDEDWFGFTLPVGDFSAELTWDERTYIPAPHIPNDLDLFVQDSSGELAFDDALAPGDSPAVVSATLDSAGAVQVLVFCFQADADLFYQGTLTP